MKTNPVSHPPLPAPHMDRRLSLLGRFGRLSAELVREPDIESIYSRFLQLLLEGTESEVGALLWRTSDGAQRGVLLSNGSITGVTFPSDSELLSKDISLADLKILSSNLSNLFTTSSSFLSEQLRDCNCRLFLGHSKPQFFNYEHTEFISSLSELLLTALSSRTTQRELKHHREGIDAVPHLAFTMSPKGDLLWCNEQWSRYTGKPKDEILRLGLSAYLDPHGKDDILVRWKHLLEGKAPAEITLSLLNSEGDTRLFLIRCTPVLENGTVKVWYCTGSDVHERTEREEALKASEARLKAVLAATPECVKIVAPDGSLLFMNDAGRSMIEVPVTEEIKGAHVERVIPDEYLEDWREFHSKVCAGEQLSWQCEIVGLNGTKRWVETNAVPLKLADGTVAHLAVTRDISERKKLEQEREQLLESERAARQQAERANHSKDEFVAILSHELRSPLNAILGWTQMLRRGKSTADRLEKGLEIIERNTKAQAQLIADLLDINRIVSGKLRLEMKELPLGPLVIEIVEGLMFAAEEKNIEIQTDIEADIPSATVDPTRFHQILSNLLTNAIKFTPSDGWVKVKVSERDGSVHVSVEDCGEGLETEVIPHIFERYRQADSSSARKHGGLGLGLFIVKRLTELHGGRVAVESRGKGQGARFTVSFPLTTDQVSSQRNGCSRCQIELSLQGTRILAIDDENDSREVVATLLEARKAEVMTAPSADSGLEIVREWHPDLIISDIGMPGKDGYHFIRELRSLPPEEGGEIPAIALTAFTREEDQRRALTLGFQKHLSKPLEVDELCAAIATLKGSLKD